MPSLTTANNSMAISAVTEFVETSLDTAGAPMKISMQMCIAVDEIMANIVSYSGASEIAVDLTVDDKRALLTFTDDGTPYDPTKTEDPDITLSAEDRKIGGLGIFMVRKTMDELTYSRQGDKNVLTISKVLA